MEDLPSAPTRSVFFLGSFTKYCSESGQDEQFRIDTLNGLVYIIRSMHAFEIVQLLEMIYA